LKDLKHMMFFEKLLQEAKNELVEKSCAEGKLALGYNCYFMPETLLNLPGCFSARLRAPNTSSIDVGTYYMSSKICSFTRCILERGIEGGYDYLSALFTAETCQMMHRGHEHFELLGLVKKTNPKFFMSMMDVPFVDDDIAVDYYAEQLRLYVLDKLSEVYGVDTSVAALLKAIELHNEVSEVISAIGELRKADNPVITGYEFHVIQLVSQVCPQTEILPYLRETLAELLLRKPDASSPFRVRLVVAGSEIDDPEFIRLIEDCGAMVVADRFCYGSLPGREKIELQDGESALHAIARHYLMTSQCPRFMNRDRGQARQDYIKKLYEDYKADGVLYEQMKFCEFWSYERVVGTHIFSKETGIPTLGIEKEYSMVGAGQLRTRIQAFVESLEIKEIQGGKR